MEDLVSMCERRCRKACNLRSAAEDSEEACNSGSSGGRARRYRKRGSPKPAAGDAGAMDTDPSPVRLWESEGHSEGYRTAYEPPSDLLPLGVGGDVRADRQDAYGPRACPEARCRGLGEASPGQDSTCAPAHGTRDGPRGRYAHGR